MQNHKKAGYPAAISQLDPTRDVLFDEARPTPIPLITGYSVDEGVRSDQKPVAKLLLSFFFATFLFFFINLLTPSSLLRQAPYMKPVQIVFPVNFTIYIISIITSAIMNSVHHQA
jgi:hypothetical protein